MAKRSVYTTMQLIADILSFKDNGDALSKQITHTTTDWDAVVIIASNHLMLPALYCRLKAKSLLERLPEDLKSYLEEIADINRGRNEILLAEAHEITQLFNKENIDHVFIKGMSLIAGGIYNDPAERMVGDIDILVAENQIHTAFDLLTKHGYTDTVTSIITANNHRHLPRQVSSKKFGAIELHTEILIHKHRPLIDKNQVLNNKRIDNGIAIPSIEDSIKISILAFQINDKARIYGHLSFKAIYDCLSLSLPAQPEFIKTLSHEKYAQSFLELSSIFFKELAPFSSSLPSLMLRRFFLFRLNYPKLGNSFSSVIYIFRNIQLRFDLLYNNKSYRRHIMKHKLGLKIK